MGRKRLNGEGSWGKKKIKGVEYVYFRDSEQHYTYGRSQKEVQEKLDKKKEQKTKVEHLVKDDEKLTFADYMKVWLYERKFSKVGVVLESTTFDCYEGSLNKRFFKDPISTIQLSALSERVLADYLKRMSATYARGSIKKTWQVLKLGLTDKKFKLYSHVPEIDFSEISVPSEKHCAKKAKVIKFTSSQDMERLYDECLRKKPSGAFYYGNAARLLAFIMYSGLREAEACGLMWKDVDMKNEMITINQTYNMIKMRDGYGNSIGTAYVLKDPKSEASAATIPYRQKAKEILELMEAMNPRHKPNDFVFLTDTRTPFQKRHVLHTLKRVLKNAGLEEKGYTVHELRHGYGSILYKEGVDLLTISKLLRHKDIETTANIYVETEPETLQERLKAVDSNKKAAF